MDPDDTLKLQAAFDPESDPYNYTNVCAARDHGLRYDPRLELYVDSSGFAVRDAHGQPLLSE